MKTLLPKLIPLFALTFLGSPCAATTVLTNLSGVPSVSQLINGPGGFLTQPIAYGFEFTVDASSEYLFDALTLSFSSGSLFRPLTVELFYSPTGPNTATLLTPLTGPTNPLSGQATWTSPIGLVLDPSETYFVQLTVNAGPASYGLQRTAEPITGDWTFVSGYTKNGSNAWNAGAADAPIVNISATAIPEPAVSSLLGAMLWFSKARRRRPTPTPRRKANLLLPLLLLAGGTLGSATAQQVYLDFDQYPVPAASQLTSIGSPHTEDGLQLTSVVNATTSLGFWIPGPLAIGTYAGTKTFFPFPDFQNRKATITLSTTNGRRFTLKSLRLHPFATNYNQTVTFVANNQTGNLWTKSAQTGNSLAGTVVTFDNHFENLVSVYWELGPPAPGLDTNRHQLSEFLVEFQPQLTTTGAITVNEATGAASVPIRLTTPRSSDTAVPYVVNAGTATLTTDFNYPTGTTGSGVAIIPTGQTQTEVLVPIVNDTTVESLETLTVTFTNPPAGTVFPGSVASILSTVSIASDDGITNFAGWMTAHGLTGNNALVGADPNRDGVSNLESWLCRINPAGPSPAGWLARRSTFLLTTGNRPALRFTVPNPAPSDVRIILHETSSLTTWSERVRRTGFDLGSLWTGPGANRVVETSSPTDRTITLPGSATTLSVSKQFLRLEYELVTGGGSN